MNTLPHLPFEAEILKARQKWLEEVSRFLQKVRLKTQAVEVCLKYRKNSGYKLDGKQIEAFSQINGEFYLRIFQDGHIAWQRLPLEPQVWESAFEDLRSRIPAQKIGPIYRPDSPQALQEAPNTLDSELVDQLNDTYRLQRIAYALSDNTWHESDRTGFSIKKLEGQIYYSLQHRVVGNQSGAIADTNLSLKQHIQINHFFRDEKQVIYAPSSWLPWAMQGANVLRNRGAVASAKNVSLGHRSVILHPRLIEKIIRARLLLVLSPKHVLVGQQITSQHLTLTHELGANGMILSSAFDDLGQGRASFAMIDRGRICAPFSIDPLCAEWTIYGLRPQLSNFFIMPGQSMKTELMESLQDGLWIEDAEVEAIQKEFGPNYFSIKITEGFDASGALLTPKKYILSGYLVRPENIGERSTKNLPILLDQLELSKEIFDTGSALVPFMKSQMDLSIYQPFLSQQPSEQAKKPQLVPLSPVSTSPLENYTQKIKEDSTPVQGVVLPKAQSNQISTSATELNQIHHPHLKNPNPLPKLPPHLPVPMPSTMVDIPNLSHVPTPQLQPLRAETQKLNHQLPMFQEKSDLLSLAPEAKKGATNHAELKPKNLPPRLPPKVPKA
jgi:hypothetical protein